MILIKENTDKTRAVYKLADGRYRKVWSTVDEKALKLHGETADTVKPTQEFIDKIYEFCLGNINTTYPYAHGDWSLSNIILTDDDVSIVDWDNVAVSDPKDVIQKLHNDLKLGFGDDFNLPSEFTVPDETPNEE